ncbi:MAG: Elongation factor Ts [Candidatus Wolfebacteria bacterium GW2011_GWA2_42_10]|uniref:Elongation factor Ts n=2 Tax=Candidatus Wolfeibacteriota TaxID=1752735 RepID=A0A0G0ZU52_9BACT|nr:MAG: Elongation factor Ts [Candidatus Wolfebacteria bacterium GW2011_GWB1_41_12]KKS25531.1 MAG: Elongation factor Ts [Candidatus Wolfebacteria bacterium GW2011_GWA2_42_10]KKT56583.1 MAG: Elongation factor Ts [Candidatus Wolfebacteria bacterium GW2011_GWA1_44_24]
MKDQVQKLRDITSAGVMDCKRALQESDDDLDKAVAIIHEKGLAKAERKSERATGAGLLHSYIHNERVGVLLELRCETDFAARNPLFKELAHNLAMQIAAMNPADVKEFLAQNYVKDESLTIEALLKTTIAKIGENIRIEKFCRYEI